MPTICPEDIKNVKHVLRQIGGGRMNNQMMEKARAVVSMAKTHRIVVLTGAGASMPLQVPGMKELHEKCLLKDRRQSNGIPYSRFHANVGGMDLEEVLTASYLFRQAVKKSELGPGKAKALRLHKDLFNRTIQEMTAQVRKGPIIDDSVVKNSYGALSSLDNEYGLAFFTTNYDMVVEKNRDRSSDGNCIPKKLWPITPRSLGKEFPKKSPIYVKLHGCISEAKDSNGLLPPVLSKSVSHSDQGFDRFRCLYAILGFSILQSKAVLIIGQSLRDAALRYLVEETCKIAGARQYVINSNPGPELKSGDCTWKKFKKEKFGYPGFPSVVNWIRRDVEKRGPRRAGKTYKSKEFKEHDLPYEIISDFNKVTRFRSLNKDIFSIEIGHKDPIWRLHCRVCDYVDAPILDLYDCILLKHANQWKEGKKRNDMIQYATILLERAALW